MSRDRSEIWTVAVAADVRCGAGMHPVLVAARTAWGVVYRCPRCGVVRPAEDADA